MCKDYVERFSVFIASCVKYQSVNHSKHAGLTKII